MYRDEAPSRRYDKKLRRLIIALLPSFLITASSTKTSSHPHPIHPTAWLDGMRGYAAFAVFMRHYEFAHHRKGLWSFGTINDPTTPNANHNILQLPIIRLLYHGEGMVCLFFVISGYALSLKTLRLIRGSVYGRHQRLLATLASSIFRRSFRLFLPCLASTSVIFVALRLGVYNYPNSISEDVETFRRNFLGFAQEFQPHVYEGFWEQA